MSRIILYDYWRSSAAYRVRIALAFKGLDWESRPIDLAAGDQAGEAYRALNPQGLVPALEVDGVVLTQSLAIIEYLEARWPEPALLPADPALRARAMGRALVIAADVHPIANLRVLKVLRGELGVGEPQVTAWIHRWIGAGFDTLEAQAPEMGLFGGTQPDISDLCLVPQMYNARRFDLPLARYPRLVRIDAEMRERPQVAAVSPEAMKPA